MAATLRVAVGTVGQSGLTATVALTGVTAGSRLVVFVRASSDNRTITGVAGGGSWADVVPGRVIGGGSSLAAWICEAATGGDTTATVTFDSAAASLVTPILVEVLGLAAGTALEVHGEAGQATGTTVPTGPMTTLGDGRFVLACGFTEGASRTCDLPTGYTAVQLVTGASNEMRVASLVQTSAGAITTTFPVGGGNTPGAAIQLGLIVATGGGAAQPPRSMHQFRQRAA